MAGRRATVPATGEPGSANAAGIHGAAYLATLRAACATLAHDSDARIKRVHVCLTVSTGTAAISRIASLAERLANEHGLTVKCERSWETIAVIFERTDFREWPEED